MDIALDFEWYRLFYLIGIGLGTLFFIRETRRVGLPTHAALSLVLWALVFGIIGSRIAETHPREWLELLRTGFLPDNGKTMLGGLLGAMLGIELGRRALGIRHNIWGWFLIWPGVLAVIRVGCLLTGCCVGTPTDLPWGLSYPIGTPISVLQHQHGHIGHDAVCTLPVHPAPVYEIIFSVLLLIGIFQLQRRGWSRSALLFLSLALYSVFRFGEEFIRPEHMGDGLLNPVQIGLLIALPLLLLGFVWYRRPRPEATTTEINEGRLWTAMLAPISLVLLLHAFWTVGEMMALGFVLASIAMAKWMALTPATQSWVPRFALPASLLLGGLLMSQAAIDQTVEDGTQKEHVEVGFGTNLGKYREACGPNNDFYNFGAGAQYVKNWEGNHQLEAGARAYIGNVDRYITIDSITPLPILGANPYVAYQNRWFGIEVGGHVGQLLATSDRRNFLPDLEVRLGPSDIFFVEGRVFNQGYNPIPNMPFRIGVGSGFGIKNGTVFRMGAGLTGFYFNPTIVFDQKYMVEPLISYGDEKTFSFGLGLRMKIGLTK
jgi:prolipoprotein diacylglyceryltransferase